MCNQYFLFRELSGTSDTGTITNLNVVESHITCELPEKISRLYETSAGEIEEMKLPSPNSLQDNRGGGALMNLALPNTLCEDGGSEGINVSSLYSPHSPRESSNYLINEMNSEDPSLILNKLRIKNNERIIIGHRNINHIEKKSIFSYH